MLVLVSSSLDFSMYVLYVVLLLVFAGLGILSSLVFRKLVWCRYLCPLGALLGLLARCSFTEMRSNHSLCNNDCPEHKCLDRYGDQGCPVLEAPFTMQSNQDCILCGECVKVCSEESPAFNLRLPGYELGTVRYPTTVMAVLVPALMGTQLFRGLLGLQGLTQLSEGRLGWLFLLGWLGLCSFLALGLIKSAAGRMFGTLVKADLQKDQLLNYALVPLLFAYETGYHLELLLSRGGRVLSELGSFLGLDLCDPAFSFSPAAVQLLQVVSIAAGCSWTSTLVNRIAKRHQASGQGLSLGRRWPVLVLAGLSLSLLLLAGRSL